MTFHAAVLVHDRTGFTIELCFICLEMKTHLKCFLVLIVLRVAGRRCMVGNGEIQMAKK